jgi:hypothetical protein
MGILIIDDDINEILNQYAKEIHEEKIRAAWKNIYYEYAGYEFRRDLPALIAQVG